MKKTSRKVGEKGLGWVASSNFSKEITLLELFSSQITVGEVRFGLF